MTLHALFKQFGRRVNVKKVDNTWESELYRAFIQPLRYKNKMYLEDKRVPIGIGDMSYYLYLGPAEHDLSVLDNDEFLLRSDNESFLITRAERIYIKDEIAYIWAVLKKTKEEEL